MIELELLGTSSDGESLVLTDAQGDDALHGLGEVEELADARGRAGLDDPGQGLLRRGHRSSSASLRVLPIRASPTGAGQARAR